MRQIWKFPVQPNRFSLDIPMGAQILHLAVQGDAGEPQMWVLVNPEAKPERRTFTVYGTGWPISNQFIAYIGTFMMEDGALVFHVFEELK